MYKKGDIVKIRGDLMVDMRYGRESVVNYMVEYFGKTAIIMSICAGDKYTIDIDVEEWKWTAEMFESVKPKLFKLL